MLIGIPRALYAYSHYPLWQGFLAELGVQTILSPTTNREILETGVRLAPSEICLPVKAYFGHVVWLRDRCDAVLIPRIVCLKQDGRLRFGCPKALALPDLCRSVISPLPKVIELNLDERIEPTRKSHLGIARILAPDRKGSPAHEQGLRRQSEKDAALISGVPFSSFWESSHSSFVIRNSSLSGPQPAVRTPQSQPLPPGPRPRLSALESSPIPICCATMRSASGCLTGWSNWVRSRWSHPRLRDR